MKDPKLTIADETIISFDFELYASFPKVDKKVLDEISFLAEKYMRMLYHETWNVADKHYKARINKLKQKKMS